MSGDCLDEDLRRAIVEWSIDKRSYDRYVAANELLERVEPLAEAALTSDAPVCTPETAAIVGQLLHEQRRSHDVLLRYAAKHLRALAAEKEARDVAHTLSIAQWETILSTAAADDALDYIASLPADKPAHRKLLGNVLIALAPRLRGEVDEKRRDFVRLAADRFPECTIDSSPNNNDTFEVAAAYALKNDFEERKEAWTTWVERWASGQPSLWGTLARFKELLSETLTDGLADRLLRRMSPSLLEHSARYCQPLFMCLTNAEPSGVADVIASGLRPTLTKEDPLSLEPFVEAGISLCIHDLVPELAFLVAKDAATKDVDPERTIDPAEYLNEAVPLAADAAERIASAARIWMYVRSLEPSSRSSRYTHNAWAFKAIRAFIHASEREWLQMLRVMPFVLHDSVLSIVEELTLTELASSGRLGEALDEMSASRDRRVREWARDMDAHRSEIAAVNDGSLAMFSRVARYIDRGAVFPNPLKITSSTWFAAPEVEGILRVALDEAAKEFGFSRQLGQEEETLTFSLLQKIETALRNANVALRGFGPSHSVRRPLLEARQETKHYEAGKGLDAAVIVNVDLPGHLKATWTSLIQAKKAHRNDKQPGQFVDTWSLKTQQVRDLMKSCEDAVLLFYAANGDTHVVAARLISAILEGKGRMTEETATIHYCELRSMAISLSQYLVDLVMGGWYGCRSDDALKIAHGEDLGNRPKSILEVTFTFEKED